MKKPLVDTSCMKDVIAAKEFSDFFPFAKMHQTDSTLPSRCQETLRSPNLSRPTQGSPLRQTGVRNLNDPFGDSTQFFSTQWLCESFRGRQRP